MKLPAHTGFAVIYQWRLKQGMERQFHAAWAELTEMLKQKRGAQGSRLHHTDQGTLVAYAQWPDRYTWEQSCSMHNLDENLSKRILDAVEETWSPMFLTTISDHLMLESTADKDQHGVTH